MTNKMKSAFVAAATVIAMSMSIGLAKADEWNKETRVTFNLPVEVAHTTLPAGTYIFKLADIPASRDIVQVFSEDRRHLIATFFGTATVQRNRAQSQAVTLDHETGSNPVVRKWFYPYEDEGREFPHAK